MKIDRHNYEEYFILYVDNELNAEERRGVEEFVHIHPDLRDELDILMQAKLIPDDNIAFENKEELMMINGAAPISLSNYEEWLVLYMDNELDASQRLAVEQFMNEHPTVKEELFVLLQTRVEPETTVVFPDKNLLYRHEERRRIGWWKIAAAAILLIAAGTTAVLILNKKEEKAAGGTEYVSVKPGQQQPSNQSAVNPVTPGDQSKDQPILPDATANSEKKEKVKEEKKTPVINKQDKAPVLVKQNAPVKNKLPENKVQQPEDKPLYAENKKPSNDLPSPVNNPNVNAIDKPNTKLADAIADNPLTKSQGTKVTPPVTKPVIKTSPIQEPLPSYANNNEPANDGDEYSGERSSKKNKLRGFLRKVTRTFEKTTNIDATDQDDRLLVGGLAIRLK